MHIEDIQSSPAVKTWSMMLFVIDATRIGGSMPTDAHPSKGPRLTALSVEAVVLLLKRSGAKQASVDAVRADLAAGAPQNPDGTINLITYGAWLVSDLARREGGYAG
jgi:hypothetical protein